MHEMIIPHPLIPLPISIKNLSHPLKHHTAYIQYHLSPTALNKSIKSNKK